MIAWVQNQKNQSLNLVFRIAPLFCLFSLFTSCGLIQRSDQATNVETTDRPTTTTEEQPQLPTSGLPLPNPKITSSKELFDQALTEENYGAYLKASELWQSFIARNTGMPGFEDAHYHLALCLFRLGRPKDAIAPLKYFLELDPSSKNVIDARLLLAESLEPLNEALALTFEVLPNTRAEKRTGLERTQATKLTPSLSQKIRLYTLRGRIYTRLKKVDLSRKALDKAQHLLETIGKKRLPPDQYQKLSLWHSIRRIESIRVLCETTILSPERLSEAEFLAYAGSYYHCASQAKPVMCRVLDLVNIDKDEGAKSLGLQEYRQMVEYPLHLLEPLPPPARPIKKSEQISYYENEMKALIKKTVFDQAKEFKSLEACNQFDLF